MRLSKHPLLVGTAVLTSLSLGLYGCKNFLTDASKPQGTLDQSTLANAAGVEGSLIAAYRTLVRGMPNGHVVDASQAPTRTVADTATIIIDFMAARTARRFA